jgi:outer membrane protein OmpA-like peptidoglycan-associated protein
MFALIMIGVETYPQKPVKKKVKEKTEQKTDEKIDETLDKGFNKIGSLFKKKKKDKEQASKKEDEQKPLKGQEEQTFGTPREETAEISTRALKWSSYDFVPGERIIFEDNNEEEENGEFPSRWDLVQGAAENAEFDNQSIIYFRTRASRIIPYLKNASEDYLPEKFTLEFDAWFEKDDHPRYDVWLSDLKNQKRLSIKPINIWMNRIEAQNSGVNYPGIQDGKNGEQSMWRHISISFNKRALKAYLDDARLINIPILGVDPTGITIGIDQYLRYQKGNRYIKNIRIAEGAVKLYDRVLSDGKIVANGIRFDVNKATIRPESMGVINEICALMKEHPELKFSIEGHTDSDGDADFNLGLSEKRAESVRNAMIGIGIEAERLITKGFGETIPVAPNDSPEGKATNRRVEFVKM